MIRKLLNNNWFVFLLVAVFVFIAAGGFHQTNAAEPLPGEDLTVQNVFAIVNGLACWLIRVVTAIMVIFIVLAGFRFMAARGDAAKLTSAKKNLTNVLIGVVVIMGVYVIIATVANAVGADFSFIPLRC